MDLHPNDESNIESSVGCCLPITEFSGCSVDEMDDHWLYEASGQSLHVLGELNDLRQRGKFCDIKICVATHQFSCHKIVLVAFSPYFKAMFIGDLAESKQNEITMKDVDCETMALLIDYAYTAKILITKLNVQNLLSGANLLGVLSVKQACCQFMKRNMDVANCLGIHCFAELHDCPDLLNSSRNFVFANFIEISSSSEFLTLHKEKLIEFISSDNLMVSNEKVVFEAVLAWLNEDQESRLNGFDCVLEHVRLPLLSPYYLYDFVQKNKFIVNSAKCKALIEEAKTYHLLQDRRTQLQNSRTRPRKLSGTCEVIIAVGGEDDKVVLRAVESYDPHKNKWKSLSCLPYAISKHGLVVTGANHVYLAGGEFPDGSASRNTYRYDPCLDQWTDMAPMSMPRSELGLSLLDGMIYAVGGWEGSTRLDSVECYNPISNKWHFVSSMKMAVTSPAVVAHAGLLYVTGGAVLEDGDGIDLVQCYEPHVNQWFDRPSMLIPRSGSAACIYHSKLYVIGGWHASTENTNKVECFDPETKIWELCPSMNERRYRPGVAVYDDSIYVCGGEEGWDRYHDTVECFNLTANQWTIIGEMSSSRSWLTCISLTMQKDVLFRDNRGIPRNGRDPSCVV